MSYFLIRGGTSLKGSVSISGSSDATVSMIAASLLTDEVVHIKNVPAVESVQIALDLVKNLGVAVEESDGEIRLRAENVATTEISKKFSGQTRAEIVALGPLLARFGRVSANLEPSFPLDRHLKAFEALGAEVSRGDGVISIKAERLVGVPIRFEKSTILGTENAILASVLAAGETTILGAAVEPEVDDLIEMLNKMGAVIARDVQDLQKIVIQGVDELSGFQHEVLPDRNETAFFAIAAAATCGDVTLQGVRPQDLTALLSKFQAVGAGYDVLGDKIRAWADSTTNFQSATVETAPHPGFMSAWQAPFSILLAQAGGESLIHETVYLRRFGYFEELAKMGVAAEVLTPSEAGLVFDPGKYGFDSPNFIEVGEPKTVVKITGPAVFRNTEVWATDFYSGMALTIAALVAPGESRILGIKHIDRVFEGFDEKLRGLGAHIERFS